MIPVRLQALTTGGSPTAGKTQPLRAMTPPCQTRIFQEQKFVEMRIQRVVGDHVIALHDGETRPYAIGHLPKDIQHMLSPKSDIGAHLAGSAKRTILGLVSDQVIEDLRDEDPHICPIALAIIRRHSPDPGRVICEYLKHAVMLGDVMGQEMTIEGREILYRGCARRLTVEMTGNGWVLEGDSVLIPHRLPVTICTAASGRPLAQIIEHEDLVDVSAMVVGAEAQGSSTRITFSTNAIAIRTLKETQGNAT